MVVDPIPVIVLISICLCGLALFYGLRAYVQMRVKKFVSEIKKFEEETLLASKKVEVLEQHRQDLKNALDANIKAMDDKKNEVMDMRLKSLDLERSLDEWKKKYTSLLNQKKSSEVRVGLIGEQIAPFLDAWPFETKNFKFMGAPIDGISFEDDGVVLIEIKTGNAKLSPKQRQIRKQVRDGNVRFMEFRIEEDGYRAKSD